VIEAIKQLIRFMKGGDVLRLTELFYYLF